MDENKPDKAKLSSHQEFEGPEIDGMGLIGAITKGLVSVCKTTYYVSMIFIVVMLFLLALDVALRLSGHNPTIFGFEFTEYGLMWISILPAGLYLYEGKHISVDFFYQKFKPAMQSFCEYVSLCCAAIFSIVIVYFGVRMVCTSVITGARTNSALGVPLWWIEIWVPIAFAAMGATAIMLIILKAKNKIQIQ